MGLNCYMNALLQCLFNIKELRDYYINEFENKRIKRKEQPISYHFSKVMYKLLYSDSDYITPYDFKKAISKKNPLFKENKAADVADLFRNLIDSLLSDFNPDNNEEEEVNEMLTPLNLEEIIADIKKKSQSNIIYQYMNVYNLIAYKCPYKHEDYIYSIVSDSNITFNLENIIKKIGHKSIISLQQCFKFIQEKRLNNNFYCSECQKVVIGESFEKILFPPKILIIILNRGKGKTIKNKVKIDTTLDISDLLWNFNPDSDKYYKLIGSCNHYGESSPNGHYTACCLYEDGLYYSYNDKNFKSSKYYESKGDPYILFYRLKQIKKNNQDSMKNIIEYNISDNLCKIGVKKYENILNEVSFIFVYYKNQDYSIEIKDNIFIWTIKKKGYKNLIMKFPKQQKFYLLDITTVEGTNQYLFDYLETTSIRNLFVDLEDNPEYIYEKISIYFSRLFKVYLLKDRGCRDLCIIT